MTGRNPVTIRYLICTICIVMLVWGCDGTAEPSAQPKVVRKKIVQQKRQVASVRKKKNVRKAKVKRVGSTPQLNQPDTGAQPGGKPLLAQNAGSPPAGQKKPAIQPRSDISEIKQPLILQQSTAGAKKTASGSDLTKELPGIHQKYNPTGKINPFEPLFREKPVMANKKKRKRRLPQTPLERIDISQLKLVGIVLAASGNRALVEESSGKGYVIKKGTYIGINSGKVIKIKKQTVIIEEEYEDVFGKVAVRQRQIKLPKPPGAF